MAFNKFLPDDFVEPYDDAETLPFENTCRLCCGSYISTQLVDYSSFLNLIIKCFPTLNIEHYETFPKRICLDCRERLINFSIFVDKVLKTQKFLESKLIPPTETPRTGPLRIKQEPFIIIKEEKVHKSSFIGAGDVKIHGLKDKIYFKPPVQVPESVPDPLQLPEDDDIEILSPLPMKVEEIPEEDEAGHWMMFQPETEHNYSRPFCFPDKVEEVDYKSEGDDVVELFPPVLPLRSCSSCGQRFRGIWRLLRHKTRLHRLPVCTWKNFFVKCFFCRQALTSKRSLSNHLTHTCPVKLKRTFKCKICHMRCRTSIQIYTHRANCRPEDAFRCFCGAQLKDIRTFRQHQVLHSDPIRKFICEICGQVFKRQNNLRQHTWTHAKTHAFKCMICGHCFKRPSGLRVHTKKYHWRTALLCET